MLEHLQSQLPATDVILVREVPDRIDESATPGTVTPADRSFLNPALRPTALSR
ncbi:hypothetical protein ACWD00_25270 [Streptomyces viridiviolaceus]